ncbi:molybdenum cofactor sulfurase-like [Ciona intestinalis]
MSSLKRDVLLDWKDHFKISMTSSTYPKNLKKIRRKEFKRLKGHTFLDFGGCSLYSTRQIDEFTDSLKRNVYGNPHSGNPSSDLMAFEVGKMRNTILEFFNVTSSEYSVVFTSGATAGMKIVGQAFNWTEGKSRYVYLEDNHTSVVGIREVAQDEGASAVCLRFPKSVSNMGDIKEFQPKYISSGKDGKFLNNNQHNKLHSGNGEELSHLFAYPAQSNFSGRKYPLGWIRSVRIGLLGNVLKVGGSWYTMLDAAAFVTSSKLDLKEYPADFVSMSFYKMFGFPTGIGALLVRNTSARELNNKVYFGGGTTRVYLPSENFRVFRSKLHERFEEGTISFLDILALKYGFSTIFRIVGSIENISHHLFNLTHWLYHNMKDLTHRNGVKCIKLYSASEYKSPTTQGATIAFNVVNKYEGFVGFNEVLSKAAMVNIHLRGGCFCNVGACNYLLAIGDGNIKQIHKSGYVCGEVDIVEGQPVGAVRITLGYMTTKADVKRFLSFIKSTFVT